MGINGQLWVLFGAIGITVLAALILTFFNFPIPDAAAADDDDIEAQQTTSSRCIILEESPEKLEGVVYTTYAKESSSEEECVICLEGYRDGHRGITIKQCSHRFHADCVEPWLREKYSCPLCRSFPF